MVTAENQIESVAVGKVTSVSVDWLALDRLNPRLMVVDMGFSKEEIIAQLYRSEDLAEMLESIAANGYLDIEPLIVHGNDIPLTVLEGNRRLAAIRLFREQELAERIYRETKLRITLPEFPPSHRASLEHVSVYRVASRENARSFIGFKHINGAAKWDSYAKAKFAADWYRKGDTSLAAIAKCIGDRHDTIKRMVNAIYVLEQAEDQNLFRVDDRMNPRFSFSHLYTALSRAPYMEFLGLDSAWTSYDPTISPVPPNKLEQLQELLRWIYGSKKDNVKPVVNSQNPDIKQLGEVLASPQGLIVLRSGDLLQEAYADTRSTRTQFTEALLNTRREIRVASHNLHAFDVVDSHSLVEIAAEISETARSLHIRMKKKVEEAEEFGEG